MHCLTVADFFSETNSEYGSWENVGPCKATHQTQICGPGRQSQRRVCKIISDPQKCNTRNTVREISCYDAKTHLPECPIQLGHWRKVGKCDPVQDHFECGPGKQEMERSCRNGTGTNICSEKYMKKIIPCEEAGTELPDCPKRLGHWETIGHCNPVPPYVNCGPGIQKMQRTCEDGTGSEKCLDEDKGTEVSCKEAGTDLPDCPKKFDKWKNMGPCISNNTQSICGPGVQRQYRKCTSGTGLQQCKTEDIVQFVSCLVAGTQLPDCPKTFLPWYNVGACVPSNNHGLCGPGTQAQKRECINGTGQEICTKNDTIQTITCQEAGSKLPECPKTFSEWRNTGPCISSGKITACGPGIQEQRRTCGNGTGHEICTNEDIAQRISCTMAGTDLPDCPKIFGEWINVGHCIAIGKGLSCGPGRQEQLRSCENGTGPEICTFQDKMQIVSCKAAGTDLPDCPKKYGVWKNVGSCTADNKDIKRTEQCGPGKQKQERTCQNGTGNEVCDESGTKQVVPCSVAGSSLPDCPKIFGEWKHAGPCLTSGLEKDCGPGVQIQERTCTDGTGSQICNEEDETEALRLKPLEFALNIGQRTQTLVTSFIKSRSINSSKVSEYAVQIKKIKNKLRNSITTVLRIYGSHIPETIYHIPGHLSKILENLNLTNAKKKILSYIRNQNHQLYIRESIRIFNLNENDYGIDRETFCKFADCKTNQTNIQLKTLLKEPLEDVHISYIRSDTIRISSCENVNTKLPDCPKQFGEWKNVEKCVATGSNPTCGPGVLVQERECKDGTGSNKCLQEDRRRNISCVEAGEELQHCPKRFGKWENEGKCFAVSPGLNCGPGVQLQNRSCIDGTGVNVCTGSDKERKVTCKYAGTDLPDCPKVLGD